MQTSLVTQVLSIEHNSGVVSYQINDGIDRALAEWLSPVEGVGSLEHVESMQCKRLCARIATGGTIITSSDGRLVSASSQ